MSQNIPHFKKFKKEFSVDQAVKNIDDALIELDKIRGVYSSTYDYPVPTSTSSTVVKKSKPKSVDLDDLLTEVEEKETQEESAPEEAEPGSLDIEKLEGFLSDFANSKFKFMGKSLDRLDHLELQALVGMLLGDSKNLKDVLNIKDMIEKIKGEQVKKGRRNSRPRRDEDETKDSPWVTDILKEKGWKIENPSDEDFTNIFPNLLDDDDDAINSPYITNITSTFLIVAGDPNV